MFRIVRFPSKLNRFFRSLTTEFHWEHFEYFRMLVLLIAFAWGRRNITNLCRYVDADRHRTRFNNFLLVGRWDPAAALQQKAHELLGSLKPRPGETLYLILDDSKTLKRGKEMEAAHILYDSIANAHGWGHQYVAATLSFGSFTIPWGIRLYVKQEHCPDLNVEFAKTTQLAAQLIREFTGPPGVKVTVLFDSFYLCPTVVGAVREAGFRFVSTLKANRNLHKGGRKLKTGHWSRNFYRRAANKRLYTRGDATYRYVDAGRLHVSRLGELHVVLSRKNKDPNILALVSDHPRLSAKGVIETYAIRWKIEVFFKDAKQLLGLGQYQSCSYRAAVTHLHLVCFAHALLTHLRIQRHGAQGKRKRNAGRPSMATLQNELRRIVWDDLVDHLKRFRSGDSVVKELGRLLVA